MDFIYMEDTPPLNRSTVASLFMPRWLRRLRRADFVYCGDAEAGQAVYLCKPLLKGPVILDVHGDVAAQSALNAEIRSNGARSSPSLRVRIHYRMAKAAADCFLTVSEFQTAELVREGIQRDRISLVRNGVDLELFSPDAAAFPDEFTVAYAGGLQSWQGTDLLIEAFGALQETTARLLMVGFADRDRELKTALTERFGDKFIPFDRMDQERLIDNLRRASLLIIPRKEHPAIRHAFPTKFAEYAALGKPLMVNDVDETADFVRKYDCGFVSQPNADSMAQTLRAAAASRRDKLAEMGRRARAMAEEHFSWDIIGRQYHEAVKTALDRFGYRERS